MGANEVTYSVEGSFQDGAEGGELGAVVGHEAGELGGVLRGDLGHFGHHAGEIAGGADVAAGFEDEVVLRVEADEVDFAGHLAAAGGEDVVQHAGVEEEGGAHVEAEAAFCAVRAYGGGGLDGGGAAADALGFFEDGVARAGAGEEHGGGKAPWAGADYGDAAAQRGAPRWDRGAGGRRVLAGIQAGSLS